MLDTYWVRVKPLNKKRGHVVERVHVLGRIWQGGNGIDPNKIPEWVKVNAAQAAALRECKQIDNDPYSQGIFDIVTEEMKVQIDTKEENVRKAILGFGSQHTINELPNISAGTSDVSGTVKPQGRLTLDDLKGEAAAPTMPAVDELLTSVGTIEGVKAAPKTMTKAPEVDLTGRADAMVSDAAPAAEEPVQVSYVPPPAAAAKGARAAKAKAPVPVPKPKPAKTAKEKASKAAPAKKAAAKSTKRGR